MRWLHCFALLLVLASASLAAAVQPDEILSDATLEARARALSRELRCMVCQNQSIDDSDAPLARDLRVLVRERLKSAENPRQWGKPLHGDKQGLWRYRVGDYRLICDIQDQKITLLVLEIGHRKDVYR